VTAAPSLCAPGVVRRSSGFSSNRGCLAVAAGTTGCVAFLAQRFFWSCATRLRDIFCIAC
jgi:hypothetical protein